MEEPKFPRSCSVSTCKEVLHSTKLLCQHVLRHIQFGDNVKCPLVEVCESTDLFSSVAILTSHLSMNHSGWKEDLLASKPPRPPSAKSSLEASTGATLPKLSNVSYVKFVSSSPERENPAIQHQRKKIEAFKEGFYYQLGYFYLQLKAELVLAETTVQSISESLAYLSELVIDNINIVLSHDLRSEGISEEIINKVVNNVCHNNAFHAAHHKKSSGPTFTSGYLRQSYIDKNFPPAPTPVIVSLDREDTVGGAKAAFVPPRATLEYMFKDKSVEKQILKSFGRRSDPDLITDYVDGEVITSRDYPPRRIDLLCFQDGFGLVNPLGSAKNKHKYTGAYITLGNLKPHNRSKLKAIHLAMFVADKLLDDVENYGPVKCFKPLIDAFNDLQANGIIFMGEKIPVYVQFIVGDNLGANSIGGFVKCFTGHFFCRFCEVSKQAIQKKPSTVKAFRTFDTYMKNLEDLKLNKNPKITSIKGVKHNSVLNEIKGFHVCDPRLAPCTAHDLYIGIVSYDLSLMIKYFVDKNWFSYDDLDRAVKSFELNGPDANNRPAPVNRSGTKLGGHCVQNWTFVKLFPIFIQDFIKNPRDKVWKLYLKLKLIVEWSSSPAFRKSELGEFSRLLKTYVDEMCKILKTHAKPKHHMILHYDALVRLMGVLVYLGTLRWEAKHQFFKGLARITRNFKNILRTVVDRHALYQTFLSTEAAFPEDVVNFSRATPFDPEKCEKEVGNVALAGGIRAGLDQQYRSLELDGINYQKDAYVLLQKCNENISIGQVKAMLGVDGKTFYFVLEKFVAKPWSEYGVYCIDDKTSSMEIFQHSCDNNLQVQPVYFFKDKPCFSLKHRLLG